MNKTKNDLEDITKKEAIAVQLVQQLSVEDIGDCINDYMDRLMKLGEAAIKPLREFIATEGKEWTLEAGHKVLRPARVNYDAAKVVLEKISKHDYSVYYLG